MIAEIFPDWYDVKGRKVFRPDSRRRSGFQPTFPIGRFISQPLKHPCSDFLEMWHFLSDCKYVSDQVQFGKRDYWQPPEEFEESKKGDCEDFALWAWRQLIAMKYPCRFVVGPATRYGEEHAWVTFEKDGKQFLLESLAWPIGLKMPRLSIVRYKPRFSVSWDGETVSYYEHDGKKISCSLKQAAFLGGEWLFLWTRFWLRTIGYLGKGLALKLVSHGKDSKR